MIFEDRVHAGRLLAERLQSMRAEDPVVLGLPRGGVPVAFEVAKALDAPLDVIIVRKLGVPFQPELGMGAIGEGGVRVLNPDVVQIARVTETELEAVEARERRVVEERAGRYRSHCPMVPLEGRTVILVDDGIATGGTARAAVQVARARGARRVVVAVPVAAPDVVQLLGRDADEVIAVQTPEYLMAIGGWYQDFRQTTDEELIQVLDQATARQLAKQADPPVSRVDEDVTIVADGHELGGHLDIPEGALGIVLFAHGSGSSRYSPRNRSVASFLNQGRLATLLFDLLTPTEANDRSLVFDIPLLAQRLRAATAWLRDVPQARDLPIGYFGASTGAGAALWAAADPEASIAAVVSRGGRPDLAIPRLADVRAPTLLIVGGYDSLVLDLNEEAARHLRCERRVAVVPGASHLFEEPGTLAQVAQLARDWFVQHFEPAVAPAEHTERPR